MSYKKQDVYVSLDNKLAKKAIGGIISFPTFVEAWNASLHKNLTKARLVAFLKMFEVKLAAPCYNWLKNRCKSYGSMPKTLFA